MQEPRRQAPEEGTVLRPLHSLFQALALSHGVGRAADMTALLPSSLHVIAT